MQEQDKDITTLKKQIKKLKEQEKRVRKDRQRLELQLRNLIYLKYIKIIEEQEKFDASN